MARLDLEKGTIQLEVTEQEVSIKEAVKLRDKLNDCINEYEIEKARNRQYKGKFLYTRRGEKDRLRFYEEVRFLFSPFFVKYIAFGYHPREIFMLIFDCLQNEADTQRRMYKFDQRKEAPEEKE